MRLKLGFFSDANVLSYKPHVDPKVRVRLKLGCGLNKGFNGSHFINFQYETMHFEVGLRRENQSTLRFFKNLSYLFL